MILTILALIYLDWTTLGYLFLGLTVLVNLGDRFNLREGNFTRCEKWYHYAVQYGVNLFYSLITQEINTVLAGHPDNSFSGRIGKAYARLRQEAEVVRLGRHWFDVWPNRKRAWFVFVMASYWLIGAWFFFAKFDFKHCQRRALDE